MMVDSTEMAAVEIAYDPALRKVCLRPHQDPGGPPAGFVRVHPIRVGFCGTDREIVRGAVGWPPNGGDHLVLGHEMVGTVSEVGSGVAGLAGGDVVAAMVREGCGRCGPCTAGRADYCLSGDYREHGIRGLDGYARPAVLLPADMLVAVPPELTELAVLTEPLSVVCKAVDEARFIRSRIVGDVAFGRLASHEIRVVVAGVGTIGLLATYLLSALGHPVSVIGVREADSLAAKLVAAAGARYVEGTKDGPASAVAEAGSAEVIIEAAGDPALALELLGGLAPGGVLVWLGVPGGGRRAEFNVGELLGQAIDRHHVAVASVNASRAHFVEAVSMLGLLATRPRFSDLITAVLRPAEFEAAIWQPRHAIKQVVNYG